MAFEFLINQISEEPANRYINGVQPVPGDTICLICSENGTVYKGYNTITPSGENVHAEVNAINSLRADGQSMIRALTIIDSFSNMTIIPCTGCLNMMLAIDYRNINTLIATPTGNIPITNFLGNHQPVYSNQNTFNSVPGFTNQGMNRNVSAYVNNMAPAGAPIYMNGAKPSINTNAENASVSQPFSGSINSVTTSMGQKSYTAGGAKKSNVLKNKLSNLLDDDDK